MQKKESFCFLLGCFNRYAVIFCSPTETETYRNRKFDPETEISASGSTFGFISAQPLKIPPQTEVFPIQSFFCMFFFAGAFPFECLWGMFIWKDAVGLMPARTIWGLGLFLWLHYGIGYLKKKFFVKWLLCSEWPELTRSKWWRASTGGIPIAAIFDQRTLP